MNSQFICEYYSVYENTFEKYSYDITIIEGYRVINKIHILEDERMHKTLKSNILNKAC